MSDLKFEKVNIRSMLGEDWTQLICSSLSKSFAHSERSTTLGKACSRHALSWCTSNMLCFFMMLERCPCIDWCGLHTILHKRHKQHFSSPFIFIHLIYREQHSIQAIFIISQSKSDGLYESELIVEIRI